MKEMKLPIPVVIGTRTALLTKVEEREGRLFADGTFCTPSELSSGEATFFDAEIDEGQTQVLDAPITSDPETAAEWVKLLSEKETGKNDGDAWRDYSAEHPEVIDDMNSCRAEWERINREKGIVIEY